MKRQLIIFAITLAAFLQNTFALDKLNAIDVGLGIQNDLVGFKYSRFIPLSGGYYIAPQIGLGALTIGGAVKSAEDLGVEMVIPQIGVSLGKEFDKGIVWAASLGYSNLEAGEKPHGETDLTEWTIAEGFKYIGVWRRKTFDNSNWYYSLGLEFSLHTTKTGEKVPGNQVEIEESSEFMPMPIANIGKWF